MREQDATSNQSTPGAGVTGKARRGNDSILNVSNVTIDTYPQLSPTPIVLNPVVNSEKAHFYDILIEDRDDKDGDVTVMTDNTTPQGKLILAGNVIANEASQLSK